MPLHENGTWQGVMAIPGRRFRCGFCGERIGSDKGYFFNFPGRGSNYALIYICPICHAPTYFEDQQQHPGYAFGEAVQHVPAPVTTLYDQARTCTAAGAYTPAVLASRKLLMHIAVDRGADEGKNFMEYVEFLSAKGFVPPDGKGWVDHIRKKGNEANHEIVLMERKDAEDLLIFSEMLLKFIYEFPKRVPPPPVTV